MPIVHFLNVLEGDCSIVQHGSGRVSVIDVNNAMDPTGAVAIVSKALLDATAARVSSGNFNQKSRPANPIEYMHEHGIRSVWRFILTHPDMDHMGGIKDFFRAFGPPVFWDTANRKEIDDFNKGCPHNEEDWLFYKALRDSNPRADPQRMVLHDGADNKYFTRNEDGTRGGDGLYVLASTPTLMQDAIAADDYNDASYVILYRGAGGTVLFAGDSHDKTWEYLLDVHEKKISNVDVLIAPHHGRKSGRSYAFLDVVRPRLTLFGNARHEHLAYDAWRRRELPYITNNQANCVVVDVGLAEMPVFVTCEGYARQQNPGTNYSNAYRGWHLGNIK